MNEKIRILITDDDLDLRELLTEAVRNWGYVSSVARDAEEALRKLRNDKFDIVISDLMMPGMDGLALLKKIKEYDRDILVIMITGYATIETAVKAIDAGAYDYIAKPFRLDELMIVIKNACERLKLIEQNNALLEELRAAYSQITSLKASLAKAKELGGDPAGSGFDDLNLPLFKESVNPMRQQEYLKEADRFVFRNKTTFKT